MHLDRYQNLREKIRNRTFEKKHKSTEYWLYRTSFLGNIGSIFFAFFLINPSLNKTIANIAGDGIVAYAISIVLTITFLTFFELMKRILFKAFSSDFISAGNKFKDKSQILQFILCLSIISASFYFSLSGAAEFSRLSIKQNSTIEKVTKLQSDSLKFVAEDRKKPFLDEIESLRSSNKDLRIKRDNTPINYRNTRAQYNALILDNEKSIESNLQKIKELDQEIKGTISEIKSEADTIKDKNILSDNKLIWLFLIISTIIELVIIIGVWFREYYSFAIFVENEEKLEPILIKKEKYEFLLDLVYRSGKVKKDEEVISLYELTNMVQNKVVQYPPKLVLDFYNEMTHIGAFKMIADKRYAVVDFNEAVLLIDSVNKI